MASENIEGTVTDSSGNPLQDAVIALFLTNINASDGEIKNVQYTRTDSNGNYVIKDHPDADSTSQEWHVAGFYQDGTGEFNALSKPSVDASVGPTVVNYNFETGNMSSWNDAPYMAAQTNKTFDGTYSGFTNHSNDNYSARAVPFSQEKQIVEYSHYQAESSNGNGIAVVYYDGSGNEVFRSGSSNRDIQVAGANGSTRLQKTGNLNWYNLTITFDWGAGTFTATSEDGSTATHNLKSTNGIKSMEIWPAGNVTDLLGGGDTIYAWYDNIKFFV